MSNHMFDASIFYAYNITINANAKKPEIKETQ